MQEQDIRPGDAFASEDISKQKARHAPSPNPPLLPVIDGKVSKQKYPPENESETKLESKLLDASSNQSPLRLACPFWRLRPMEHILCAYTTMIRPRDVRNHLLHKHRAFNTYCPKCLRTFQTAIDLEEHSMEERLCEDTCDEPGFLTIEQIHQLECYRSSRGTGIETQWYQLWDICFPGRERPDSISIEDVVKDIFATALASYRDFVSLQLLHIFRDVLPKSGYNGPDQKEPLSKILQNGLDLTLHRWATIWEEKMEASRAPPTIEPSSSASRWSGSTLAATDARGSPCPSDFDDCEEEPEKVEWSPEEDSLLVELKGSGTTCDEISDYLRDRSTQSCRRRYLDLHAKWSEGLKMKLSAFTTTERCMEESKPHINRCELDTGTTVNPAQAPLNPDTKREECLSTTQVASSIAKSTPILDDMDTLSRDDSQSENHLDGSDKSENSMVDDAALYDSSRFAILESNAADQLLDAYYTWSRTSTFCNTSCAASQPTDTSEASKTPNSSSGSNPSAPSAGASASMAAPTSQAFPKSTATLKRKRHNDGDSDDEDQHKSPRVPQRKHVKGGEKRLACPFQKRYHPGHLFCGENTATRGFITIANVKQHVRRSHLHPPLHCTRCKTEFDDVSEMDSHKNAMPPCEELPYVDETKLLWNKKLVKAFSARVNVNIDIDKQWFSVWDLLFPDAKRPASCRVEDDELCKHLLDFQQFVAEKGDSIVEEILRESDFVPEAGESDQTLDIEWRIEERQTFGVRVLNVAAERFIKGRASPCGPHVARYKGHISPTKRDGGEMTDSCVGAATFLQAPPEIQAPDEADVQPETLPGGDITQHEGVTLPAEGRVISSIEAVEFDFSTIDIQNLDSMKWDMTGQFGPGFS